jgi:hypothetical protein
MRESRMKIGPVLACRHPDAFAAKPGGRSFHAAPLNPLSQ